MSAALGCPSCLRTDKLWTDGTVEAWHDVEVHREADGSYVDRYRGSSEADWSTFASDGNYGCSACDWSGSRRQLVRLGTDGQPLAEPIPGQGSLPL